MSDALPKMLSAPLGNTYGHAVCAVCRQVRMIAEMQPDQTFASGYGSVCKSCHAAEGQRRRYIKERALVSKLRDAVQRADQLAKVTDLCNTMLETYGGLRSFCEAWHSQVDFAMQRNPGSATVLQQFTAIAKIIMAANAAMPPRRPESELSEEEMLATMQRMVKEIQAREVIDGQLIESDETEAEVATSGNALD